MTPQNEKLEEAQHQYNEMLRQYEAKDYQKFKFALSAFVNAGRSILQYTHKKADLCRKVSVYNRLIKGDEIIKYFKDIRDINIHAKPISTKRETSNSLASMLIVRTPDMSDDELAELIKQSNEVETIETVAEIRYMFDNWPGTEDVLELSDQYLKRLETFIKNAEHKGLIH